MKATIKYFLSNITAKNQKLAVKQILVDKPWALIDSEGEIQKLIFKDDNGLILSKNGKVVTGTWEYFPNSRALFIDRGTDKILLQDQYIDENILLLKRDGTDDDFFALANEHVIPDYNVENYLRSHVYNEIEMETRQEELDSGDILVIEQGTSRFSDENCKVSHFTKEFKNISLPDGRYFSKDHSTIYVIENQIIRKIIHNQPLKSYSGEEYFIEDLTSTNLMESINHPIFHPKQPLINATIQYSSSTFILVDNGIIRQIYTLRNYEFHRIGKIVLQQKLPRMISSGDQIYQAENFPVPDGRYRIKGTLKWIKFHNNKVV